MGETKITRINFFNKTKQNKKEIIILGILIWMVTALVLNPSINTIWSVYGPKPNIVSNVILYKNANFSECCTHMTDFFFLYYLGDNSATMLFLNASDKRNIGNYGKMISPNFQICDDCSIYSFSLKNSGNMIAEKIVIDIKSSSIPDIIIDNPKMTKKDCGGSFESKGCYVEIESIKQGEEFNFALKLNEDGEIFIANCYANEIYPCEFNFIKVLSQNINPYKDVFEMNGTKVIFPTHSNSEPNILYYFDPNKFDETKSTWVSIPTAMEFLSPPE